MPATGSLNSGRGDLAFGLDVGSADAGVLIDPDIGTADAALLLDFDVGAGRLGFRWLRPPWLGFGFSCSYHCHLR